jgi:hypothetical protein
MKMTANKMRAQRAMAVTDDNNKVILISVSGHDVSRQRVGG